MKYSLKPFLLDALLSWAHAQQLTTVLVVRQHPKNELPEDMDQYPEFSFIMTPQAVEQRSISTDGVRFHTFMKQQMHKVEIFLPYGAWLYLKIKETGQRFDLAFEEHFHQNDSFPQGVHLHHPHVHVPHLSTGMPHPLGRPRLVDMETGLEMAQGEHNSPRTGHGEKMTLGAKDQEQGGKKGRPYLRLVISQDQPTPPQDTSSEDTGS